jgi:hypothetical protein
MRSLFFLYLKLFTSKFDELQGMSFWIVNKLPPLNSWFRPFDSNIRQSFREILDSVEIGIDQD